MSRLELVALVAFLVAGVAMSLACYLKERADRKAAPIRKMIERQFTRRT